MDNDQLQGLLSFAVDAARGAGDISLQYFQKNPQVELKADDSPVTAADRNAEEYLRSRIEKAHPGHGILGEEFGEKEGREPGRWIVDPIDGTFSFICGVPLYSNLVGFEWQGQMVVGVINLPAINEIVYAAKGLGCTWNDVPAAVSHIDDLSKARLATTSTKLVVDYHRYEAYQRLREACKVERGWPDAYGYALLATGRVDIMLDPIMSIWDTSALLPVVTEAGGTFTDWSGQPSHTAPEAIATNGRLHTHVLNTLRSDVD